MTTSAIETDKYLDDIALPWLSDEHREHFSHPITEDELKEEISSLPNNKAPGMDGLPGEFNKEYGDLIIPHLTAMYSEAYEEGVLPPSLREALLITLLKLEKDPTRCDSYRPLSLINKDAKILAKIIALRIQPLMQKLILSDQSGFIPMRSTTHNLRTIFAMFHQLNPNLPAAVALLDAAKAFDSEEWPFMFSVLRRLNCSYAGKRYYIRNCVQGLG